MMQLTDMEYDKLTWRAAAVLSCFQPGEDAIAVLSRIYQENLPDKSPRQGELMARELISQISHFRRSCDAAAADPRGYVRYMLTQMLKDQSEETRCQILRNLIEAEQGEALSGPMTSHELMETAVRLMSGSVPLPPVDSADSLSRQQAGMACGEDMILAATAMMLYTMAKNGELSSLPEDITLAEAALCVCTNDRQCQLMWLEASGNATRAELEALKTAVSLIFKMTWLFLVIPKAISAFTATGAFAVTAGALGTLAVLGILTALAFHEFDHMLSIGTDAICRVPLNLQSMGTMTLEAPEVRQETAPRPVISAVPEEDLPDIDPVFF